MVPKNSKKWLVLLISIGLMAGSQGAALAADSTDWLSSLFGGNNSNNNQQTQNNSSNQSLIQGASEAAGRSQANINQDNLALQQDYQRLEQDRRAGLNTAADMQAIQAQRLALQNDQTAYYQQTQQMQTYQGGYSTPAAGNQSLLQGAAEAVNRSQANISQDNLALQQDYQKLEQDKKAGVNTAADMQAIRAQRQAMQNDQTSYNQQLQQLRTYQGLPAPVVTNTGYGVPNARRWDRQPQGYYNNGVPPVAVANNGAWQQNPQYQHPENWNGHHRRNDADNDNR
jgi:hypothetical protein